MLKNKFAIVALLCVLLAGCQTPLFAPTPSPTPTSIPLSEINLRSILFLPEDLPADYSAGVFKYDHFPEMYGDISGYENAIYQEFKKGGNFAGWAVIFLFESPDRRDSAYSILVDSLGENQDDTFIKVKVDQLPGVGEKGMYSDATKGLYRTDLAFTRCQAVVHFAMTAEQFGSCYFLCKAIGSTA